MSSLLPLPLYLLVPRGFVHALYPRRCVIPCVDAAGNEVAQVRCEPRDERKLWGCVSTHDSVSVSVSRSDGGDEPALVAGWFRDSIGFRMRPKIPTLQLEGDADEPYEAINDWCGIDARVRDAQGKTLGMIGMRHVLSNAFEVRDTSGALVCVIRALDRRRRRQLALRLHRRQGVIAFEEGGESLDARFLVAWFYAFAMKGAAH